MKKADIIPQIPPISFNFLTTFELKNIDKKLESIKRKEPTKIVYFGTPEFSAHILEKLIQFCRTPPQFLASSFPNEDINLPHFSVQAVITSADKPVGRKQISTPSAVSLVAEKYNIPTLKPEKLNDEFIQSNIDYLEAELFIVASFGKILPQQLLDIPILGAINIHGSLLPQYRGASPIQTAILNGDKTTGITIIKMDARMDHGPILLTKQIDISNQDTYQSLSTKMSQLSAKELVRFLPEFVAGKVISKAQNETQATYCQQIKKDGGYFKIDNPPQAEQLNRMVRAFYPWPNAWTKWNGKIVKLLPERMVQLEGKKPVKLDAFLNGYPDFPIKQLN